MMKTTIGKVLFVFFILGMTGLTLQVSAQGQLGSTHTQDLFIVKYGLPSGRNQFSQRQTTNTGEKINNIPVDNHDSELAPIAGIHYVIQKIIPTRDGDKIKLSDKNSYSVSGKPLELVTNSAGIVSVNLSDGFYIVSEQANAQAHLSTPAHPILIRLPVENTAKNGYLNEVYIYPKSNIDPLENTHKPKGTSKIPKGNLPKTGDGSKLSISALGVGIIGITFMLMMGKISKERGVRSEY
ncbi:MAG: pilin N-terminal domain-containing protein [Streptococcaceae bacterium]|nr:pilin N-terminal domain-containing protein [Streptococcaceae bacterium]